MLLNFCTIILFLPLLASSLLAQALQAPCALPLVPRVLFLGNSITHHAPGPKIGWSGNWGMAASAESKDYVHLLTADLTQLFGAAPRTMVRNIAAFERGYAEFDVKTKLREELEFKPNLVIIAIGENLTKTASEEDRRSFATAMKQLLDALREQGMPRIIVRSCFWPDPVKDKLLSSASEAAGATFLDIGALAKDETNQAKSERKIEHAGVAAHPGDKGMRAIADALYTCIKGQWVAKP